MATDKAGKAGTLVVFAILETSTLLPSLHQELPELQPLRCSVVLPVTDVSRCCVAIFPELKQFFLQEDSEGLRRRIHKTYRLRILENPQTPNVIEALKELLGEEYSSSLALPGGAL